MTDHRDTLLLQRVREICLALPRTEERLSHGEPTFFVGKKVFAMCANNHHQDGRIAVWIPVPPGAQSAMIEATPRTFFRPPYVGVRGWVGIELREIDTEELAHHLRTAWRLIAPKRVQSLLSIDHTVLKGEKMKEKMEEKMEAKIVEKPAFTVVGMLIHTKPMTQEIPDLWGQFGPRMDEVQHLAEPGVSYGLMDHFDQTLGQLDYMAGEAVEKVIDLPAGMTHWDVPANTYAVFETTLPDLGETFGYVYNTWLSTSGYQQVAAPYFERYGETFDPGDPTSTLSIYIPVEKKT